MATFIYGMNLSLDGYVDHERFAPDPMLFSHWIEQVRDSNGAIYGRRIYEIMQYWDEDQPGWSAAEREFADAWRHQPKWVFSRTLTRVGPNATLVSEDAAATIRGLKQRLPGRVDICGTILAGAVTDLGLIDEYRLYFHPVVLGAGTPYFAGPRPRLRPTATERFGSEVIRLTFVPA